MLARTFLSEEERKVDPQLGYPRGYAKLCRNAATQLQGLITPFTEGPPQRFMPYTPQSEELARLKELDSLFPVLSEAERDPPNARKYADFLWRQLDHLGNAGFDPAKFRVDIYGNVLYWHADAASPLAWEIDHWFPHSRGGKTVMSNLRVLQWQINQRKANKLEFIVPWWDLQLGVSVNQFLSAYASKNVDFRKRSLLLFFARGEEEQAEGNKLVEMHTWPAQFRERKAEIGIAAAAIVSMSRRDNDDVVRTSWAVRAARDLRNDGSSLTDRDAVFVPATGTPARRRWNVDEEEALRRAVQKFGPGSWKEIKENEPALAGRSTVQIKDKYRLMRGDWHQDKENVTTTKGEKDVSVTAAIQKETKLKQMREDERKVKEEELAHLQGALVALTKENEAEFLALEDLEALLIKNKEKVEKQRRWAETQSSYRICLERMIRDTMHQSVNFKEQARLNQAACNALLVRLDCQKQTSVAAGTDLVKKYMQREELLALACTEQPATDQPLLLQGLEGNDISEEEVMRATCLKDEPSDSGDTCGPSLPSVSESACDSGTSDPKLEDVLKDDGTTDGPIPEREEDQIIGGLRLQPLDTRRAQISSRTTEQEELVEGLARLKVSRNGSGSRSHHSCHSGGQGKRSFDEEREKPGRLPREGSLTKKMRKQEAEDEPSGLRAEQANSRKPRIHVQDHRRDKPSRVIAVRPGAGEKSSCAISRPEGEAHHGKKEIQAAKKGLEKCGLAEQDASGCRPLMELDKLPKDDRASRVTEWLDAVGPPKAYRRYGVENVDTRDQRDSVALKCTTSRQLLVDVEEDADGDDDAAELDVVVVGFEYADIDKGVVLQRQETGCLDRRSVVLSSDGTSESSRLGTVPHSRRTFTAPMPITDEIELEEQKKVIVVESPSKACEVATTKLDDIVQEMLDTQLNRSSEQQEGTGDKVELEDDDEKIRQLGKSNLDKWLHVLLHKEAVATLEDEDAGDLEGASPPEQQQQEQQEPGVLLDPLLKIRQDITSTVAKERADQESYGQKPTGLLLGLLKKLSFRQPLETRQSARSPTPAQVPEGISLEEEEEKKTSTNVSKEEEPTPLRSSTRRLESSLEELSYAQTEEGSMSPPPSKGIREDWDAADQAKSGLRASIKAATVAWRRAVKKMEPRPAASWALI